MNLKKYKLIFISTLLLLIFTVSSACASDLNSTAETLQNDAGQVKKVNLNEIYVDNQGDNSNDGTSHSPLKTIQNAISKASNNATVYIADGEYSGEGNTRLNLDKSLTFVGSGDTVINGLQKDYIFIIGEGACVTFKNIKFINAFKSPESFSISYTDKIYGACLDIKNANVNIDNCSFENNVLSYVGGDSYIYGGAISNSGDLTISNSYFANNIALSTSGLFSYGGSIYNNNNLMIYNTSLIGSKSLNFGNGAGIANDGVVTMKDCIISNSSALHESKGSAIYNSGVFNLINSYIENNSIQRANFNKIYGVVYNSGTLNALGNVFRNNSGYYEAPNPSYIGSPNIYNSGDLNLTYNAFIDNAPFEGIFRDLYFNGGNVITIDNNWWNTNENPYSKELTNIREINSWLVLNVNPDYSRLNISDKVTIHASWTNNINLLPQISLIPVFNITFKTNVSNNVIISNKQLINGKAEFIFNLTKNRGLYTVTAVLESFTHDILVDVGKMLTEVKFSVSDNITYLDDLIVDVEVTSRDNSIPPGVVFLKISDETYGVNLTNGKGSVVISDLSPGRYDLDIIYDGSENHFKAFNRTTVSVRKLDVDLSLVIPEIKVSQKGQMVAILGPKNAQGQAIVYVDGVRKKVVYLYNGNTTISLSNFAEGQYNITLEFVETQIYNSFIVSGILNVTRYDCEINISANDVKVGENATLRINVNPDSLRGEATLIINGVVNKIFIDDAVTNINLYDLEGGYYNVDLIFESDLRYYPVKASTSFRVLRTQTSLDVEINQDDKNLNGTITVLVNPSDCRGIVGVYVNFNSYIANLTNGKAVFSVKFDKGTNYIFAYYRGSEYFEDSSWNTTLGVADEFTFFGENSIGFEYTDFNYTVRLVELNGIPMPGRVVNVEINGVKYLITTNNNGFAYLNLNLGSGKYSVSATYKNQTIHNTLTVKKVDFNLTSQNTFYGEVEVIRAIFEKGVNGKVKFIIGSLETLVDIIDGVAVCNVSGLDVGTYTVKATYVHLTKFSDFTISKANLDLNVYACPATFEIDQIIKVLDLGNATGFIRFIFNGTVYDRDIKNSEAILNLSKLNEGKYSLTVKYLGDKNYLNSTKTIEFYVKEFASDLILTINDNHYGGDLIAVARLNDNATGTVKFTIGNIEKEVSINNGVATYNFRGISAGDFKIAAYYGGDEYYIPSSNETSFKVTKANSTIKVYTNEVFLNENIRIYASLSPNATGKVTFSMIGYYSPRNKDIVDSVAMWYISPLNNGEYTVVARYDGDNNYYGSNVTYQLKITQKRSILDVEIDDAGLNDRVIARLTLTSKDGEFLNGTVNLKINENSYSIFVNKGKATLVIGKLPENNYSFQASYGGNENYSKSSCEGNFIVRNTLLTVNLSADNVVKYYKGNQNLVISLISSSGRPIADESIHVYLNNKEYVVTTDSSGNAFVDLDLPTGNYNALIKFNQTSKYFEASAIVSISILPTVEAIDVIKLYGSGTQYFAIFCDSNGKALGNVEVTFKIGDRYITVKTLPNGISRLNINLSPGKYGIVATNPVTGEKITNSIRIFTRLDEHNDIKMYYGANKYYKVRVYDANGGVVGAGETVQIKFNGKIYVVKTNNQGYALFKINSKPKTYVIEASYGGYVVSNNITIKSTIITKDLYKKKSKTKKFKAKLLNTNGKKLKGKKIKFKFNGKIYVSKTNKNGIASIMIKSNLNVGKYKITTSYGKLKIKNKIIVKK